MNVQKDKLIPTKALKQKITKNMKHEEEMSDFLSLTRFQYESHW
jgi:hypothetical protein